MRIIDAFTFFNELDLLEFRLECLYPHVERFVISEANITFSGIPKAFVFEENRARFSKYLDKIEYLKYMPSVIGLDFTRPERFDGKSAAWVIEDGQRNFLKTAIDSYDDEVVAVISDLDEIWDPFALSKNEALGERDTKGAYLEMDFFYFYFNCKGVGPKNRGWRHAYCARPSFFKSRSLWAATPTLSGTRGGRRDFKLTVPSGWHFSYLGGPQKIIEKIEAFSHQELNTTDIKDVQRISKCVDIGLDPFCRDGHEWAFVHLDTFPEWLKADMLRYPKFVKRTLT